MKTKKKFNRYLKANDVDIMKNLDCLSNNVLASRQDVANLLEENLRALCIKIYKNNSDLYTIKKIPKRNGEERCIYIPNNYIKKVQRKLLYILNFKYKSKDCSHGFEKNKCIKSNAMNHVSKKYILKLDIKDFFPSINFKRIYGVFKSHPFNFNSKVATFLSHMCIYQESIDDTSDLGVLPQGAPTSPLLANLICRSFDNQMLKLATYYKCTYTRYADDIYLSTNLSSFPEELFNNGLLSDKIISIFNKNDFCINTSKTKLFTNKQRQSVTGLITNKKVNIKRSYIKNIRTMLYNWEIYKSKYVNELMNDDNIDKIRNLLLKCKSMIFFTSRSEFKKFHTLEPEKQLQLITKTIYDEEQKNRLFFSIASELGLYDAEKIMHENLYANSLKKPLFRNVLLGKIGYVKFIRGVEDSIYIKLWNRYCRITNSNKFKSLNCQGQDDYNRIYNLLNSLEESIDVEFKEYFDKTKLLETVNSFLNSENGGQLIFGVNDLTKDVTGIDEEIKKEQKGKDGFRTKITNILCDKFNPEYQMNVVCKFHKIFNKTICRIEVQPYCNKILLYDKDEKIYFVRQDGRKLKQKLETVD